MYWSFGLKNKHDNEKRSYILTKETLGITIMLFCALVFVMLLSFDAIFMGLGKAICTFMYGTFGYGSYLIVAALAYLGEILTFEKRFKIKPRIALCVGATVISLFLLFHAVSTRGYGMEGYGSYLGQCYTNAENGYAGYTLGGVISGLIVYPIAKLMTFSGAYVIFSLLTVLFGVMSFLSIRNVFLTNLIEQVGAQNRKKQKVKEEVQPDAAYEHEQIAADDNLYSVNENHEIVSNVDAQQPNQAEDDDKYSRKNLGRQILFENGEFAAESYRRNMIYNESSYFNHPVHNANDYLQSFSDSSKSSVENASYTESYSNEVASDSAKNSSPSYVYGDKPVSDLGGASVANDNSTYNSYTVNRETEPVKYDEPVHTDEVVQERQLPEEDIYEDVAPKIEEDVREDIIPQRTVEELPEERHDFESFARRGDDSESILDESRSSRVQSDSEESDRGINIFDIFNSSNENLSRNSTTIEPDISVLSSGRGRENIFDDEDDGDTFFNDEPESNDEEQIAPQPQNDRVVGFGLSSMEKPSQPQPTPVQEPKIAEAKAPEPEKPKHVWKKYVRPTIDLLDDYPENNNVNTGEIEESKQIICETLANFRIESRIANVVVGPAITRYDVIIEDRTNIKNALKYRDAVAMALMKENVNAYLNYSKGAISIEVPNAKRTTVGLKGMLTSSEFINAKPNGLTFTLGKNVDGQVVCPDITKMPHLLVAGTTGSGKSICLSTLIVSLLYKYGPEELRFILVDPKQVEFISYDKLPHLMINEIIYDVDKALKALNWAIKEMERRYAIFKDMTEKGVATKNLTEYNAHLPEGEEKLPKIVIILDEFGDLMLQAKKEIETRIIRLVQKARACGIHLILATQRPSVDCITGLIKSNLPTRIGFKVNSFDDSRCIFDIGGAEKLLGKGDLYFRSAENPDLARIQGCFIDTHEVQRVTDFVKANNETYFDESVSDFINTVEEPAADTSSSEDSVLGDSAKVDDTYIKALWFCVTSNQASVSMIQRRFPIGYMKACKIIDWMENMNYITQSEGSKPRKVLLSKDEFIQKYGEVDD